ncbi:MAG TPA: LysM peptidoglycan-binding domain-containing protein [Gallicola sp.]|nr:LysM peptidoglycan-binding domain-containing protein [Gallicola sp.]
MNDNNKTKRTFKLVKKDVKKMGLYLAMASIIFLSSCSPTKKKSNSIEYSPKAVHSEELEEPVFEKIEVETPNLEVNVNSGKLVVRAPDLIDNFAKRKMTPKTKTNKQEDENYNPNAIYYKVAKGDTFSSIATKNNITAIELKNMNNFDNYIIKEGQKIIVSIVGEKKEEERAPSFGDISKYGKFTVDGMTLKDYNDYLTQEWVEIIPKGEPVDMEIDLTKSYNYKDVENILFNLAKYEGVSLYTIGKSVEGRNIYAINIDFGNDINIIDGEMTVSENISNKEVILTTGQIHGREFAGCDFILKQMNDLLRESQTDPYIRALLENTIFCSIPLINPDVREAIINNAALPSSDGFPQKTNMNDVDLNRNFPSVNAGQLTVGTKPNNKFSDKPNTFFGGYTLGSEPETRAVMKWLDNLVPYSHSILDYHQQGGGIYHNKGWDTKENRERYAKYARTINNFLSRGGKITYKEFGEPYFGPDAVGGSLTDYANSVATGMKHSTKYGRAVFVETNNEELPLVVYYSLDEVKEGHKQTNSTFVTGTLEIGRTREAYANGGKARKLRAAEYDDQNFGDLLIYRAELALGQNMLEQIMNDLEALNAKSISR